MATASSECMASIWSVASRPLKSLRTLLPPGWFLIQYSGILISTPLNFTLRSFFTNRLSPFLCAQGFPAGVNLAVVYLGFSSTIVFAFASLRVFAFDSLRIFGLGPVILDNWCAKKF